MSFPREELTLESYKLISKEELTTAARSVDLNFGPSAEVSEFSVEEAQTQGNIALILRVTANIKCRSRNKIEPEKLTVIAKVLTNKSEKILKITLDNRLLEREAYFFKEAVPILRSRYPELPIPICYFSAPHIIYLQDVTRLGYTNISNISQLEYPFVQLIIEKLAQFHASTLYINWFEIIPHISTDCVFEAKAKGFYNNFFNKGCKIYANIITSLYPNKSEKYLKLLLNVNIIFEKIFKLIKASDSKYLNVLTHGDCWPNNILFKINSETKLPENMYFIDFPNTRFVPPSRDIQYLLYTCTNKTFRDLHEMTLLKIYVNVFNESCEKFFNNTHDSIKTNYLDFEVFCEEYNTSRLYGICIALTFRTLNLLNGRKFDDILDLCKNDDILNYEITQIAEEFMEIVDLFDFNSCSS